MLDPAEITLTIVTYMIIHKKLPILEPKGQSLLKGNINLKFT